MPFCPECRAEYRQGFDTCANCHVELVEEVDLPAVMSDDEIIASMKEEDLTSVARGTLEWCREVQQKLLEQRIPAVIREAEDVVAAAGHMLILQVIIRQQDLERAAAAFDEELVDALERDGLAGDALTLGEQPEDEEAEDEDGPLACPACGSTKPLKKGECRDCGLYLGEDEE
jgi:hypothetical protein